MDPHRPPNDPDDPSARDHKAQPVQRISRQRYDLVTPCESSAAGRPRVLYVSS